MKNLITSLLMIVLPMYLIGQSEIRLKYIDGEISYVLNTSQAKTLGNHYLYSKYLETDVVTPLILDIESLQEKYTNTLDSYVYVKDKFAEQISVNNTLRRENINLNIRLAREKELSNTLSIALDASKKRTKRKNIGLAILGGVTATSILEALSIINLIR